MGKDRPATKSVEEPPASTVAPRKRPTILKSGNAGSPAARDGPALPPSQAQLLFPGWTGKTPLSLLYEACQKRGWDKPTINAFSLKGQQTGYGAAVTLRCTKAKDSKPETLRLKAPEDSPVAVDRPTANEAKHYAAVYALFRFANNTPMRMVLPPPCRDYWATLERQKKETPLHLEYLWSSDPFAAARDQQAIKATKETKALASENGTMRPAQPSKAWQKAPYVYMADHLRDLAEATVREIFHARDSARPLVTGVDAVDPSLAPSLLRMGFRKSHVDSALAYLASPSAATALESLNQRSAALEYLRIIVPEDDLPASLTQRKPAEMAIRLATSSTTETLAQKWIADSLHEEGFPLRAAEMAVEQARGQRLAALALLLRQLHSGSEHHHVTTKFQGCDAAWHAEREASVEEDLVVLESIYGDAFQRVDAESSDLLLEKGISLRWFHSHQPQLATPALLVRSVNLPVYMRLHLTRMALHHLDDPSVRAMIQSGSAMVVGEIFEFLKNNLRSYLEKPPDPHSVMSLFDSPAMAPVPKDGPQGAEAESAVKSAPRSIHRRLDADEVFEDCTPSVMTIFRYMLASDSYATALEQRKRLPAWDLRSRILEVMASTRVIVIAGETGSGKTTQIPAFVLESLIESEQKCSIVVTQPRRISAVSVAERVASEHAQDLSNGQRGLVGYAIRGQRLVGPDCRLLFCTTGLLLRRLATGDPDLRFVTHVFVDEVHERSVDSDILLLELKDLLRRNAQIKVILMSATIQEHIYADYFGGAEIIRIPGRTFPVEDHYLEDLIPRTDYKPKLQGGGKKMAETELDELRTAFAHAGVASSAHREVLCNLHRLPAFDYGLVGAAVHEIIESDHKHSGAILVFCSGITEIHRAIDAITAISNQQVEIWPLHATLSPVEQGKVFRRPRAGRRKVIVATNVAETSITIDDVAFVVDTGRVKEIAFDPATGITRLVEVNISRASANQRRGRAGRTQSGQCWRLYDKSLTWKQMKEHNTPEVLRTPLERIVLESMALHSTDNPAAHIGRLLTPPDMVAITTACRTLRTLGAVEEDGDRVHLTALGEHLSMLPLDVRLGKMLILGAVFSCLDPMLTTAALLSARPLFVAPREQREEAIDARRKHAAGTSDLLTDVAAFDFCQALEGESTGSSAIRKYCEAHFISYSAYTEISSLRSDLVTSLAAAGCLAGDINLNRESLNTNLLASVIFASTQHLVRVQMPEARFDEVLSGTIQREHHAREVHFFEPPPNGRVFVHPSSILFGDAKLRSAFVTYFAKSVTTKPFLRDVTAVPLWGVLLFAGGGLKSETDGVLVSLPDTPEGWCRLRAWSRVGALASALRRLFDQELRRRIEGYGYSIRSPVIDTMLALLASDGR